MQIIGDQVYGLRCPKCRLSSENMAFPKGSVTEDATLMCVECEDVELVPNKKARPLYVNMRCLCCNIGFAKTREKSCHYCGAELVDAASAPPPPKPGVPTVDPSRS